MINISVTSEQLQVCECVPAPRILPLRSAPAALCFLSPILSPLLFPVRLRSIEMHPGGSGAVTLRRGDGLIGSDWRLGGASVSLLALSFSRGAGPSNYKVMLKLKSASSRLGGVTPPPPHSLTHTSFLRFNNSSPRIKLVLSRRSLSGHRQPPRLLSADGVCCLFPHLKKEILS